MEHSALPSPVRILGRALFSALLLSAFLLIAVSAVFALAGLGFSTIPVVVRVIWFLSSFAGGLLAARAAGSRRLLWGLAAGLIYLFVLFLLSRICSAESANASTGIWLPLFCLAGGGIGGALS
ncbi:MAG: TIGR04086 family membrane protein [Lachnospiraceae bacterium]|nr:TIGR04086 family membrane protein [Lachnospiraceae bacterium]